uniref:Uncharacterized protein n=1 Tax=Fagus sylvatica TaxID=28930 RepID=A0A2N9HN27_FAGSY
MPTLFPPLTAPADVPSTSGSILDDLMGPANIILPSWYVPLYQVDGSLRETTITRHTNVLGYPILEDAHVLCGNMKTMMTDLSRGCFSRPLESSSRGAQADPDATKTDNDDDSGAPTTQRRRYV